MRLIEARCLFEIGVYTRKYGRFSKKFMIFWLGYTSLPQDNVWRREIFVLFTQAIMALKRTHSLWFWSIKERCEFDLKLNLNSNWKLIWNLICNWIPIAMATYCTACGSWNGIFCRQKGLQKNETCKITGKYFCLHVCVTYTYMLGPIEGIH